MKDRTIRDVNTEVIEKMDKLGYGLLKDGKTFYEKGYELNPRDSITFTMRQAYKIVSLKQPEKQEIEIAERKGMLSAYKEVLAFRSTYLYDDYSSLYQQSKELQKEYYEEMGKFLAKKIKELEGKND